MVNRLFPAAVASTDVAGFASPRVHHLLHVLTCVSGNMQQHAWTVALVFGFCCLSLSDSVAVAESKQDVVTQLRVK